MEVGDSLFQFKFSTEFDMERILHGSPWTFDNQLLLLQKWHRGITARNVSLDYASLWIQIWDAPFDMVSPTVAKEVGGRLGKVEDVEKRRNIDDQNFFMRVKVALPISKPLRCVVFLASAGGEQTWCKFKYERLPLFCHYCGMLGHDLRHCAEHFVAIKHDGDVKCQYRDWMRAFGGRSCTLPKRFTTSPPRSTWVGGEIQGGGAGKPQSMEPVLATSEKHDGNPREERELGSSEKSRIHLNGHQCRPLKLEDDKPIMERGICDYTGNVTEDSNSKVNEDHVPIITHHVQEIKTTGPTDSNSKPKWTHVMHMECGPIQLNKEGPTTRLGKRGFNWDAKFEGETKAKAITVKQRRTTDTEYVHNDESARVENYPCQKQ